MAEINRRKFKKIIETDLLLDFWDIYLMFFNLLISSADASVTGRCEVIRILNGVHYRL
jgi:hypothetical protein